MLFVDTNAFEVITICITSFIGICAISAALEGWLLHHMNVPQRLMSALGGLLLIYPGLVTDSIGLALVAAVVILQVIGKKKALAA